MQKLSDVSAQFLISTFPTLGFMITHLPSPNAQEFAIIIAIKSKSLSLGWQVPENYNSKYMSTIWQSIAFICALGFSPCICIHVPFLFPFLSMLIFLLMTHIHISTPHFCSIFRLGYLVGTANLCSKLIYALFSNLLFS